MPLYKVQTLKRDKKVTVVADSLSGLQVRAKAKLGLEAGTYHCFDDSDGTLIDDDECLLSMSEFSASKGSLLLVTLHDGLWSPPQDSTVLTTPVSPAPGAQIESPPTAAPPENLATPLSRQSNVVEPQIPLRTYTVELKEALKAPAHLKNKALTRGRQYVVKSLSQKLKRTTVVPGDMRKLCEKIRDTCPQAFLVSIRDNCDASCFEQFVKSVYNATAYARENDLCAADSTPRRRRRRTADSGDVDDPAGEPVPHICLDSNGCVDGMYAPLMSNEDGDLFEDLRVNLLTYSNLPGVEEDSNVLRDFKLTYPLQRKCINEARTADDRRLLLASWPLLQKQHLFLVHADQLLGKSTLQLWLQEMAGLQAFHSFMQQVSSKLKANPAIRNNGEVIDKYLEESQAAQNATLSRKPIAIAVFPLLLTYFKEKEDNLFIIVNENSTKESILEKAKSVSACPLLVIKGLSLFDTHSTTYVVVRGLFMIETKDVIEGMLCLLCAYFVFNICYPKQVSRTLEFMQRFFLRVNPTVMGRFQGTKAKKVVNALVAKLAGQLTDHEKELSRWTL